MRLTEEYKRITEHFKDLQAKFSHFQQADLNKFHAVSCALTLTSFQRLCLCFSVSVCICLPACL